MKFSVTWQLLAFGRWWRGFDGERDQFLPLLSAVAGLLLGSGSRKHIGPTRVINMNKIIFEHQLYVVFLNLRTLHPVQGIEIEEIRLSKHLVHSVSPNFLSDRPFASSHRVKIDLIQTFERFRLNCSFLPRGLKKAIIINTHWYLAPRLRSYDLYG